VRDGHDRPASPGQRGVKVLAAIDGHAFDELVGSEAAHEDEVDEHATVVLEGAPGDPRDLGVGPIPAERGRVVVQGSAALDGAEPVPRRPARRRRGVPQARGKYAQ
jgi:hypothetical protein